MVLVLFFQEDDVPSVYRNLKIFCETAPRLFVADVWLIVIPWLHQTQESKTAIYGIGLDKWKAQPQVGSVSA